MTLRAIPDLPEMNDGRPVAISNDRGSFEQVPGQVPRQIGFEYIDLFAADIRPPPEIGATATKTGSFLPFESANVLLR